MRPTPRRRWTKPAVAVSGLTAAALLLAGCGGAAQDSPSAVSASSADVSHAAAPTSGSVQPVRPVAAFEAGSFEGFATYSYIPTHPTGIVYLFHGSGGGADFATKVETVDLLNELIGRGYGFIATESTDRTGDRRWNVDDPTLTSNPDLARMARLRTHVIQTTPVDESTPMYGIGMSNGSAFTALWAAAFSKAGIPVSAVGLYMAGPTKAVESLGGLRVPTFMVVGENDTRTNPIKEKADLAAISRAGVPTELHQVTAQKVTAARYLRIPGVTQTSAEAIVAAYQQAGVIDAAGNLKIALPKITGAGEGNPFKVKVTLPVGLTPYQRQAVGNETLAAIAEHQFNAEFKVANADFFDAHSAAG